MYELKKNVPSFQVVEGAMKGRTYTHGVGYGVIPPEAKAKFVKIEDVQVAAKESAVMAEAQPKKRGKK